MKYTVLFKVKYRVEIDTDNADNYPDEVVQDTSGGADMAEAMVLFDAVEGDEPADAWADWVDAEIVTSYRHADGDNA